MYDLKIDKNNNIVRITCGEAITLDEIIELVSRCYSSSDFTPTMRSLIDCRLTKTKLTENESEYLIQFLTSLPDTIQGLHAIVVNPELEEEVVLFNTIAAIKGLKRKFLVFQNMDAALLYLKLPANRTACQIIEDGLWESDQYR